SAKKEHTEDSREATGEGGAREKPAVEKGRTSGEANHGAKSGGERRRSSLRAREREREGERGGKGGEREKREKEEKKKGEGEERRKRKKKKKRKRRREREGPT
ncbi:hypothetical protein, partial [Streptococcus pyogenes]|uniref:hypothetical protein n=1 Tax=Streptococcus pyogenes TaxID=1314 RepID=UPI0016530521